MERFKQFLSSLLTRKFLLAVVSAGVVFGNAMWGWGLTDEQVWTVLTPILAFIGLEGAADAVERKQTVIVENDYLDDEVEGV